MDPAKLVKNRKELVSEMQETYGYIYCQKCQSSHSYKFHVHHIFFRSEYPEHPNLHNKKNLLIVCEYCHNKFHSNKSIRNEIVENRNLKQMFNLK